MLIAALYWWLTVTSGLKCLTLVISAVFNWISTFKTCSVLLRIGETLSCRLETRWGLGNGSESRTVSSLTKQKLKMVSSEGEENKGVSISCNLSGILRACSRVWGCVGPRRIYVRVYEWECVSVCFLTGVRFLGLEKITCIIKHNSKLQA